VTFPCAGHHAAALSNIQFHFGLQALGQDCLAVYQHPPRGTRANTSNLTILPRPVLGNVSSPACFFAMVTYQVVTLDFSIDSHWSIIVGCLALGLSSLTALADLFWPNRVHHSHLLAVRPLGTCLACCCLIGKSLLVMSEWSRTSVEPVAAAAVSRIEALVISPCFRPLASTQSTPRPGQVIYHRCNGTDRGFEHRLPAWVATLFLCLRLMSRFTCDVFSTVLIDAR
jgi:hypothetical protein